MRKTCVDCGKDVGIPSHYHPDRCDDCWDKVETAGVSVNIMATCPKCEEWLDLLSDEAIVEECGDVGIPEMEIDVFSGRFNDGSKPRDAYNVECKNCSTNFKVVLEY